MEFQALTESNCIGFLSQYKDFTNCISILPLWLPPPPPHLKTRSYLEPAALDVQVSLCSEPWGQPGHIHFSPPFKKPVWACTSLVHSRLGQMVGGPRMSSSACLTAQLTTHLAQLSLAELNLSSCNIILQLFSSWGILSIAFFTCIPTLFGNLALLTSDLPLGPLILIAWCYFRIDQILLLPFPVFGNTNCDSYLTRGFWLALLILALDFHRQTMCLSARITLIHLVNFSKKGLIQHFSRQTFIGSLLYERHFKCRLEISLPVKWSLDLDKSFICSFICLGVLCPSTAWWVSR